MRRSRAVPTINPERSWQLLSGDTTFVVSRFSDEDAPKVQRCQGVKYRNTLGLLTFTPHLVKEPADGKSIKENQLVV
jgi:hypothetical protein